MSPPPGLQRSGSGEDEQPPRDLHAALVDSVRLNNNDRDAIAYLLKYETMVRQQEAEDMATVAHLMPCMERLLELAGLKSSSTSSKAVSMLDPSAFLATSISFGHLQRALECLESMTLQEHMTTDRQWIMTLRLLCQKSTQEDWDGHLSWAEILQCYKLTIAGLQTLSHLQTQPNAAMMRVRARDRTLAMLSLFEPPSTQLFAQQAEQSVGDGVNTDALTTARPGPTVVPPSPASFRQKWKRKVWKRTARKAVRVVLAMSVMCAVLCGVYQLATVGLVGMMRGNSASSHKASKRNNIVAGTNKPALSLPLHSAVTTPAAAVPVTTPPRPLPPVALLSAPNGPTSSVAAQVLAKAQPLPTKEAVLSRVSVSTAVAIGVVGSTLPFWSSQIVAATATSGMLGPSVVFGVGLVTLVTNVLQGLTLLVQRIVRRPA